MLQRMVWGVGGVQVSVHTSRLEAWMSQQPEGITRSRNSYLIYPCERIISTMFLKFVRLGQRDRIKRVCKNVIIRNTQASTFIKSDTDMSLCTSASWLRTKTETNKTQQYYFSFSLVLSCLECNSCWLAVCIVVVVLCVLLSSYVYLLYYVWIGVFFLL